MSSVESKKLTKISFKEKENLQSMVLHETDSVQHHGHLANGMFNSTFSLEVFCSKRA